MELEELLPAWCQAPNAIVLHLDATQCAHPFPDHRYVNEGHIGTNEIAIRTLYMIEGAGDHSWLRHAVEMIADAVAGPARYRWASQKGGGRAVAAPLVTVVVRCTHGKHRSVGLAYLLSAGFQGIGFQRVNLTHMSACQWSRNHCLRTGRLCQLCDPATHSTSRAETLRLMTNLVMEEVDVVNAVARR